MIDPSRIDPSAEIHPTAYVAPCVIVGRCVKIGPHCSVGYDGFEFHREDGLTPVYQVHMGGAILEEGVELQAGVCVARGEKVGEDTILGKNTKVDNLVHIAHGCEIGENNLIAAGTIFGGHVKVGSTNFFGMNCTIKNSITIGSYNLIGAGAVVITDIPDHEICAGVPARKLRDNLMFKKQI